MGSAVEWQKTVCDKYARSNVVTFYNPRRNDWDSSWEQTLGSPQFVEQVNWELDCMDRATFVFMYITAESKAPISLLEFGHIMAKYPEKLVVCVQENFYRRGNLEVMCNRQGIVLHYHIDAALSVLEHRVDNYVRQIRI